jgi:branched-subunit amino acid transport protein
MVTSTFAHPYVTQVVALWLSFVPAVGMAALMAGALARGDRGFRRKIRISVPVPSLDAVGP